jgi:Methyltransferase domain
LNPFRPDDPRSARERLVSVLGQVAALPRLGRRVGAFYLRALWTAVRSGDRWSLMSAARPRALAEILAAARGHSAVVEVGTGTAWTTIALALAEPDRRVWSYDVVLRDERDLYVDLVSGDVSRRITLLDRNRQGWDAVPADPGLVFIDSSHSRDETMTTFRGWEPRLPAGGTVVFHDYEDPAYPGVTEAIRELGLAGQGRRGLFVWRKP